MRSLIFALAAVLAFSFATSTAMAGRFGHRHVVHHYGPAVHYGVPHHVYAPPVVYSRHARGYYVSPYPHHFHYARPGYYSSGVIGVYGGNYSFYLGY